MSKTILKVRDVVKRFGGLVAVNKVSFDVYEGEILGLIGPNGAGKTTTLRTIMGMATLYSGDIVFNGNSIKKLPTYKRVEIGITMVPEGRKLFNSLTVYENLLAGAITKRAREKLEDSLEFVFTLFPRLKERRNQLAGTLSGGESQMLAIARALMARPQVLLLDEPSLGLAPKIVLAIFDVIKKLRDEGGVTILLVEQHIKNSLEIAERGYVMELGRIVLEGDAKKLLSDERLKKAYLII